MRSMPQMTIRRMRIACWIPRAAISRSGCVIRINFPLQQWLHERSSLLRSTYVASLNQHIRDNIKYNGVPRELLGATVPKALIASFALTSP